MIAAMIELGRTYAHPTNGVALRVLRDDAECMELESVLPPGTGRIEAHRHLDFDQEFTVVEGTADVVVDGITHSLSPGDSVQVPRGAPHLDAFATGAATLVVRNRIQPRPPFISALVETVAANLVDGRLDGTALPVLHVAVLLRETNGQSYAANRPVWLQRLTMPLLAAAGRRRGYRVEAAPA
jgi:quercetin dioxygenase-like cupin family protein